MRKMNLSLTRQNRIFYWCAAFTWAYSVCIKVVCLLFILCCCRFFILISFFAVIGIIPRTNVLLFFLLNWLRKTSRCIEKVIIFPSINYSNSNFVIDKTKNYAKHSVQRKYMGSYSIPFLIEKTFYYLFQFKYTTIFTLTRCYLH